MAPVSKPRPRRNSHKRQTKITRYFHLRKPLRKPSYPVKGIKPADVPPLRIPACQPFSQWVDANIDISSATVVIGRGTYGIAYSILQPKSCVPVVLKLISMPTSSKVDEPLLYHHDLENGLMEALILQRVRSVKGIVTLRDTAIVYGSLPEKLLNPTIDFYRKLSSLQDKERVSCLVRSSRWLLLVTDHAGGKFPRQLAGAHAILILGQLAQTLSEAEKLGFEVCVSYLTDLGSYIWARFYAYKFYSIAIFPRTISASSGLRTRILREQPFLWLQSSTWDLLDAAVPMVGCTFMICQLWALLLVKPKHLGTSSGWVRTV